MTKKLASQKNTEEEEKETNKSTISNDPVENSNNPTEIDININNSPKKDYVFSTPFKKIKLNNPMAPKKKRRNPEAKNYEIKGKNTSRRVKVKSETN